MTLHVEASYRVVRSCHLELVHDVLQFVAVALRAKEPLEAILTLFYDVREIFLDYLDVTGRCQYGCATYIAPLSNAPRQRNDDLLMFRGEHISILRATLEGCCESIDAPIDVADLLLVTGGHLREH